MVLGCTLYNQSCLCVGWFGLTLQSIHLCKFFSIVQFFRNSCWTGWWSVREQGREGTEGCVIESTGKGGVAVVGRWKKYKSGTGNSLLLSFDIRYYYYLGPKYFTFWNSLFLNISSPKKKVPGVVTNSAKYCNWKTNDQKWWVFSMPSMDDSSNGRAVALYPADPGSNPHSGPIWYHFVSATRIDGCIMSNK